MKLDKISPAVLKLIRADIDAAVESVCKKYGLASMRAANASYTSNTFSIKVEGVLSAEAKTEEAISQSNQYARMLGLPENIVGKKFNTQGHEFTVERIDIGKPKFPIIAKRINDGKMFKFTTDVVSKLS